MAQTLNEQTKKISDAMDAATTIAQALADRTDAMNGALLNVEAAIAKLNFGTAASVDMGDGRELGFGKVDQAWRLYIAHGSSETPIRNASRKNRIDAVEHIPDLIRALAIRAEEDLEHVNLAIDELNVMFDVLMK